MQEVSGEMRLCVRDAEVVVKPAGSVEMNPVVVAFPGQVRQL